MFVMAISNWVNVKLKEARRAWNCVMKSAAQPKNQLTISNMRVLHNTTVILQV